MTIQEFKDKLFEEHKHEYTSFLDSKVSEAEAALASFEAEVSTRRSELEGALSSVRSARAAFEPVVEVAEPVVETPAVEETQVEAPAEV